MADSVAIATWNQQLKIFYGEHEWLSFHVTEIATHV